MKKVNFVQMSLWTKSNLCNACYLCSDIIMKVFHICVNNRVCMFASRADLYNSGEQRVKAGTRSLKTASIKWHSGEKLPPDKHWLLNICLMTDPRERPGLPSIRTVTAQQRLSDRAN